MSIVGIQYEYMYSVCDKELVGNENRDHIVTVMILILRRIIETSEPFVSDNTQISFFIALAYYAYK